MTTTTFAAERDIVRRFDAGDPSVSLDQFDDACEALCEAGIDPAATPTPTTTEEN